MTDAQIIEQALPRIADWYALSRRVLPWREEPTPYRVWISEIMLQQTRIITAAFWRSSRTRRHWPRWRRTGF